MFINLSVLQSHLLLIYLRLYFLLKTSSVSIAIILEWHEN